MQRRFPDLICIGAQKAATTWFDEMLRRDAAFYVPAFKELHYFTQVHQPEMEFARTHRTARAAEVKRFILANPDHPKGPKLVAEAELLGRPVVDDNWYGTVFGHALPEQFCVETSPRYLHLPAAGIEHLLRLNPSVKILLFVRDPVDRAWSHIRMNLARGVIANEEAVLSGQWLKQYVGLSEYRDSMTLWRKLSAPGQINTLLYDDVASDPVSVLSRVYGICGVALPRKWGAIHREVHKGQDIDFPRVLRAKLLARLAPQYEFLSLEVPEAVARWKAKHEAAMSG